MHGAASLGVEAGVLNRHRGATSQILGDGHIRFRVATIGLGCDEGDRAEEYAFAQNRHDDVRSQLQATE